MAIDSEVFWLYRESDGGLWTLQDAEPILCEFDIASTAPVDTVPAPR